jgi:hypothetical protein
MGVMPCYRNGCTNIMCNRYNKNYGYICDECFKELEQMDIIINSKNIKKFMESEKDYGEGKTLDEIFPLDN